MTVVNVRCLLCGEEQHVYGHTIRVDIVGTPWEAAEATYTFRCSRCGPQTREADARIIEQLRGSGAVMCWSDSPRRRRRADVDLAVNAPDADPPFTWDDLIDFHEALARPGWFDELAGGAS